MTTKTNIFQKTSQKSGMHFPRPIVCFFLFAVFCSSTVSAKYLYDSSTLAGHSLEALSTNVELQTKISKTQNRLTHFSLKSVPQYLSRPQPELIVKSCIQNFSVCKPLKIQSMNKKHLNRQFKLNQRKDITLCLK